MVKRLQLLPGNKLKVKSDNESGYEPFTVDFEKLGDQSRSRAAWCGLGGDYNLCGSGAYSGIFPLPMKSNWL